MLSNHSSINYMAIIEEWIALEEEYYEEYFAENQNAMFPKGHENNLYENFSGAEFPDPVGYECIQNNCKSPKREESTSYESYELKKEMLKDVDYERHLAIFPINKRYPEEVATSVVSQPYQSIYVDFINDLQENNKIKSSSFGSDLPANLPHGFHPIIPSEETNLNFPEKFTMNRHKIKENVHSNLSFPVPIYQQNDERFSVPTPALKGKAQNQDLNTQVHCVNNAVEAADPRVDHVGNGASNETLVSTSGTEYSQNEPFNICISDQSYSNYCEKLLQYYHCCYLMLLQKYEECCNIVSSLVQPIAQPSSFTSSCQQPNQQNLQIRKQTLRSTGTQTDYLIRVESSGNLNEKLHTSVEHNESCTIRKYGTKRVSVCLKRIEDRTEIQKGGADENQKLVHKKRSAVSNLTTSKRKATNDIKKKKTNFKITIEDNIS